MKRSEIDVKKFVILFVGATALAFVSLAQSAEPRVTSTRTPDGGLQPRICADARGRVHLIYFKGDPKGGDIFYRNAKAEPQPQWSQPLRVNSVPGSAVAMGTIRGAQIALGKGDRIHVAWNGSMNAPKGTGGAGMFYTRLNDPGTAFEPQRNLVTWAGGLDGGGAVAADETGNVYVAWHASAGAQKEAERAVFLAHSTDDGKTFARERKINAQPTGACGCCGLGVLAAAGNVYVQYRAAGNGSDRDTTLLVSNDRGANFQLAKLHPWQSNTCPMSSQALAVGASAVLLGWETGGRIFTSALAPGSAKFSPPAIVATGKEAKHPAIAVNATGEHLLAWTTGTGWAHGGDVGWQLFDHAGNAVGEPGAGQGVPAWSLVSAFALPGGDFVVVY